MIKTETLKNFFLLVIFCAPLYLVKVRIFGLPSNVFELFAFVAIMFLFIKERRAAFSKIFELPKTLLLSSALILVGILLSILSNDNLLTGLGVFKGWFIIPMLFSFALYTLIESVVDIENVFKSIYFSVFFTGAIALAYKVVGLTTYDNRLAAFYLSPNYLAMYLAPGVFWGLYFLSKEYLQNKLSKKFLLYFLMVMPILIALYFTYSYGAWLAVTFSLIITAYTCHPALDAGSSKSHPLASNLDSRFRGNDKNINIKLIRSILFFLVLIIILFFSQLGTQKFFDASHLTERSSLASRVMIWKSSALLIQQNPLFGVGSGNFQAAYLAVQSYFPPYLEWAVPQPHNVFLAFWLQAGIVGLIGFLWLLFCVFQTLLQIIKHKKNAALAAPLFGFFLYTVLHGLFDTTYWKNDLAFLFWIFIAISFSLYSLSRGKN